MNALREMDSTTRIVLILLLGIISYLVFLFLLRPLFAPQAPDHMNMMANMMNFGSPTTSVLNGVSLLIAAVITAALILLTKGGPPHPHGRNQEDELAIMKRALSQDEKKLLEEVEKAGEITQDSLRFRLDWSKAKVSAIVNHLDRMNILQRERQGKTYNILLSKENQKK